MCRPSGRGYCLVFWVLLTLIRKNILEFPPLHVHHIVPQIQSFNPLIPSEMSDQMPFLSFWHQSNTTFMFPTGAADNQCLPEFGGKACFYHKHPTGYGKRAYRVDEDSQYVFHVQDVRKPESEYISSSVIEKKSREQMARMEIPLRGDQALINSTLGPDAKKHVPIATRGLVHFDAHRTAMFEGVEAGEYYRASTNTILRPDPRYPHCNEFEVFITIIHFIEKRTKPKDRSEYDRTTLTLQQHTALVSHIHIPHLSYL